MRETKGLGRDLARIAEGGGEMTLQLQMKLQIPAKHFRASALSLSAKHFGSSAKQCTPSALCRICTFLICKAI